MIRRLDLRALLKGVEKTLPRSDFGAARLSLLVLAMPVAGARRVRHVAYLRDDPPVERLCGLRRLPSWHTLGRWLRGFDGDGVEAPIEVNEHLVADAIGRSLRPRPPRSSSARRSGAALACALESGAHRTDDDRLHVRSPTQ